VSTRVNEAEGLIARLKREASIGPSRELQVAITNFQTGLLWLQDQRARFGPHHEGVVDRELNEGNGTPVELTGRTYSE
jgi:hypothetical protein